MASHRMLVVHRVEGDHALHVRRREVEGFRDFGHPFLADPAARVLNEPQRGQERGHLGGVARQDVVELLATLSDEDGFISRRRTSHVRRLGVHRSISPMTISMLALMAMTSESRWPSTIFGIADRFTKDGGRMRQRTGLDVPSDTI